MGTCSSQSSLTQHFGVADSTQVDSLVITWPSGLVDVHTGLAVNTTHVLVEDGQVPRGDLLAHVED